jgi:hypothetical protein
MLTLIGLALMGAGTPQVLEAKPAPEWNARFACKNGWIGGDGVASALIGRERVLWLFGDTLVGKVEDGGRKAAMVNNSVAMQTGRDGISLRFVFGKEKDGKPTSFITPADGRGWFWPQAAVRVRDKLYLFMPQIERSEGKGVFAFRHIAQWLCIIDNPDDEPEKWKPRQKMLAFATFEPRCEVSWGSAALVHQGFLYVYGYIETSKAIGRRKLAVARTPVDKVEDFSSWQFRSENGWGDAEDSFPQCGGLATEFSVCVMLGGKRFALVYTENGLGDKILARFADAPEGPWSDPTLVYRCTEMKDKGIFTYAAKAHPWASADNELLVSYCTNSWDFGRLFRDEAVYRPKFVRVRFGQP